MRSDAIGAVLFDGDHAVDDGRLNLLGQAVGSPTGHKTAALVPLFGPTVGGEQTVVDPTGLGLDLNRALLAGVSYEWTRPFAPDEAVHVRVTVEDIFNKSGNDFAIVATEVTDEHGGLIQRQTATFIERGAAR